MSANAEQKITVWYPNGSDGYQQMVARTPVRLSPESAVAPEPGVEGEGDCVLVQPVDPTDGAIAVALVPKSLAHGVSHNGMPLASGLHPLKHADRLDVRRRDFWFSVEAVVEEVGYDPDVHGADVYCFLTKARLQPGQKIKICPGVPGTNCGVIYKSEAWDLAMLSDTPMNCANCGYKAGGTEWEPPQRKTKGSLDGLLAVTHKRKPAGNGHDA
jgi:hypothetical protein